MASGILDVKDLRVYYYTPRGAVKAVDGVSFNLDPDERFGLVGESGSGKSTIALALMRLIRPPGKIEGGEVMLDGVNVLELPEEEMRQRAPGVDRSGRPGGDELAQPGRAGARTDPMDGMRDHGEQLSKRDERTAGSPRCSNRSD